MFRQLVVCVCLLVTSSKAKIYEVDEIKIPEPKELGRYENLVTTLIDVLPEIADVLEYITRDPEREETLTTDRIGRVLDKFMPIAKSLLKASAVAEDRTLSERDYEALIAAETLLPSAFSFMDRLRDIDFFNLRGESHFPAENGLKAGLESSSKTVVDKVIQTIRKSTSSNGRESRRDKQESTLRNQRLIRKEEKFDDKEFQDLLTFPRQISASREPPQTPQPSKIRRTEEVLSASLSSELVSEDPNPSADWKELVIPSINLNTQKSPRIPDVLGERNPRNPTDDVGQLVSYSATDLSTSLPVDDMAEENSTPEVESVTLSVADPQFSRYEENDDDIEFQNPLTSSMQASTSRELPQKFRSSPNNSKVSVSTSFSTQIGSEVTHRDTASSPRRIHHRSQQRPPSFPQWVPQEASKEELRGNTPQNPLLITRHRLQGPLRSSSSFGVGNGGVIINFPGSRRDRPISLAPDVDTGVIIASPDFGKDGPTLPAREIYESTVISSPGPRKDENTFKSLDTNVALKSDIEDQSNAESPSSSSNTEQSVLTEEKLDEVRTRLFGKDDEAEDPNGPFAFRRRRPARPGLFLHRGRNIVTPPEEVIEYEPTLPSLDIDVAPKPDIKDLGNAESPPSSSNIEQSVLTEEKLDEVRTTLFGPDDEAEGPKGPFAFRRRRPARPGLFLHRGRNIVTPPEKVIKYEPILPSLDTDVAPKPDIKDQSNSVSPPSSSNTEQSVLTEEKLDELRTRLFGPDDEAEAPNSPFAFRRQRPARPGPFLHRGRNIVIPPEVIKEAIETVNKDTPEEGGSETSPERKAEDRAEPKPRLRGDQQRRTGLVSLQAKIPRRPRPLRQKA
ncbi:hypothetical protein SK128_013396 [Halocaridina rubra]|uniref:Uncharacterized protein n=1 Tax=Halocaridina rubra TaxID=373956 RepID=A0AAN8X6N3_HALRR